MRYHSVTVPPWCTRPAWQFKTTNFLTEEGAVKLCRMIDRAWADARHPHIHAESFAIGVGTDHAVRSIKIHGLLNGLPVPPA